ncbi:MAG: Superoxide dismutase [Parcubacteria group bacterium GW2011_GWC2_45_7]|nr:MAG: Superoxide dismutase [Parcubacteria group bacterium GW2011_GWC2_45_7]KKU73712.1 MAG: Superoxide dismutase [Parcubacteria group bacterium GW2011_GWA2_47_26]
MEKQVKPLKYKSLNGLSEKQLAEHHDVLYAGYVKKVNEINGKLQGVDLGAPNATHSDLRELKLEETFALNGVKLHEGYFDNLGGGGGEPTGEIAEMIKQDFGSIARWREEFKALGICARGWVVLAYDWDEKILCNILCDAHNQGGVWNCSALLILDVYEHAYFLDYATGRKAYIETFMKNMDWAFVNDLIKKMRIVEHRKS